MEIGRGKRKREWKFPLLKLKGGRSPPNGGAWEESECGWGTSLASLAALALVGVEDSVPGQGAKKLSTQSPSKCPSNPSALHLLILSSGTEGRGLLPGSSQKLQEKKMYFNFNDLISFSLKYTIQLSRNAFHVFRSGGIKPTMHLDSAPPLSPALLW